MNVLDLFSGIGGFSLGLERAGMRTVAFCEISPFQRAVLVQRWPGIPVYDDVRSLTNDRLRSDGIVPDVICGGFPCQDISSVGKRAGLAGERSGLWREYARLIGEIRPLYAIVENVAALLGRGLGDVLGDLAALRYDAEWHCIPASAVGLPHDRDRVWIIANATGEQRLSGILKRGLRPVSDGNNNWQDWYAKQRDKAPSLLCRVDDGLPNRSQRVESLGNAVVPQIPEIIGRAILAAENAKKQ